MQKYFVRMSVDHFMDKYIQNCPAGEEDESLPDFKGAFDEMQISFEKEADMLDPFVGCIEHRHLCPGYIFIPSPNHTDKIDLMRQKVPGPTYTPEEARLTQHSMDMKHTTESFSSRQMELAESSKRSRSAYTCMDLYAEFRCLDSSDPFADDSDQRLENVTEAGNLWRSQIISYAETLNARQQRIHTFSILIIAHHARLIRWDRSCVIVTERFNYCLHPEILGEFLYRFTRLSPKEQGKDPTAIPVDFGSKDYKIMCEAAENPPDGTMQYVQEFFRKSLNAGWPLWKLSVKHGHMVRSNTVSTGGMETSEFLVGKPHFRASGVVGRGTRGYIALMLNDDPEKCQFVFLKDVWRLDMSGIEQEGKILQYLNDAHVRHVPNLVCHGDVDEQRTETQSLCEVPNRIKVYRHYRLVVREIGRPLSDFVESVELVKAIYDCLLGEPYSAFAKSGWFMLSLKAHSDAFDAGILHRDISAGNILLIPSGEPNTVANGLLTDWELSKKLTPENTIETTRESDRTGTWAFMSVSMLKDSTKPHALEDDLESFFHVLLWHAIRYLPSNCTDVGGFMTRYFDSSEYEGGRERGGVYKESNFLRGIIRVSSGGRLVGLKFACEPLNALIKYIIQPFESFYHLEAEKMRCCTALAPAANVTYSTLKFHLPSLLPNASKPPSLVDGMDSVNSSILWVGGAENLRSHDYTANALHRFLTSGDWLGNDKGPDRLLVQRAGTKHRSDKFVEEEAETSQHISKRSRLSEYLTTIDVPEEGQDGHTNLLGDHVVPT